MRRHLAGILLAVAFLASASAAPGDEALPAYRERLAIYIDAGLTAEEAIAALQRWFGWQFALHRQGDELDVLVIRRHASTGQIYYMETVGTVPVDVNKARK